MGPSPTRIRWFILNRIEGRIQAAWSWQWWGLLETLLHLVVFSWERWRFIREERCEAVILGSGRDVSWGNRTALPGRSNSPLDISSNKMTAPFGLVECFSPATFSCLGKGRQLFNLFIPKFPPNIFDHRNLVTAPRSLHKMLVYAQTIRGYRKYW